MKTKPILTPTMCVRLAAAGLLLGSAALPARADYSSTVLSKNPVGYWRFGQAAPPPAPAVATNYGIVANLANGSYLNGVRALVPDAMPATTATAPSFDGFSQKVEVPYVASLNPYTAFTVEAWVKPMSIDGYDNKWYRAVVRTGGTKHGGGYQIQFDAGSTTVPGWFKFTIWNASSSLEVFNTNTFTSGGPTILATNGTWAHLVGTWSAQDALGRIYVNGVELTNRFFNYTPNTNAVLRIGGGDTDPSDPWGQSFDPGPISQVAMYDYQLTPEQILAHYQNGTNPAPAQTYAGLINSDNPVGYWPLDEADIPAQPVLTNLSTLGTTMDGRFNFGSTGSLASAQSPNYGGFENDNTAGYVSANGGSLWIPPVNQATNNVLTITAWVKRNGSQMANANILGRRVPGGEKSAFCFLSANQLAYNWDDTSGQYNFDSKLVVPDNIWTFAALVITPSNATIYLDYGTGLKSAVNTVANSTLLGFTHEALIGPSGPYAGRRYEGGIDELAVFTNALTAADMWDLRNAAFGSGLFIAKQPETRPVMLQGKASFSCIVAGATNFMPLSYQLLKGGTPVGAAGASATVNYGPVQLADLGSSFSIAIFTNGGSAATLTSSAVGVSRWPVPGSYSGLIESMRPDAYYRFRESSLATIYDIGAGFDGAAAGAVAATPGPVPVNQAGFEPLNSAYNLGTAAAGIPLSGTPINTNTVSIVMWLKPSGAQTAFTGLYYTRGLNTTTNNYVGLQVDRTPGSPGTQLSLAWAGAPNPYDWHTGVYLAPDLWNFVAVTINGTSAVMYDYTPDYGWQTATISQSFPLPTGLVAGNVTAIGVDPNPSLSSRYFKGAIDEVAVFNRTLSQAEIEKLAATGFNVSLAIEPAGGSSYNVYWTYGTLQWANEITGPWDNVSGAIAPSYAVSAQSANRKFFRVVP